MSNKVIIETMPDHLRASHRMAGNWGQHPLNGSQRIIMSKNEAVEKISADIDGYDHIVENGTVPRTYTYTIFESNPSDSGNCTLDDHTDLELEAGCDAEAIADVRTEIEIVLAGCTEDTTELWGIVWNDEGIIVSAIKVEA